MSGELGDPIASVGSAHLFEGLGDAAVEPTASSRAQILVEGPLDQCVRERGTVRLARDLLDHRRFDRFVEQVEERIFVAVGEDGHQVEIEVPANDRGAREHPLGVVTEPADPLTYDLADARREVGVGEIEVRVPASFVVAKERTGFGEMAEDLPGEERIAVRVAPERVREVRDIVVELVARSSLEHCQNRSIVETGRARVVRPLGCAIVRRGLR